MADNKNPEAPQQAPEGGKKNNTGSKPNVDATVPKKAAPAKQAPVKQAETGKGCTVKNLTMQKQVIFVNANDMISLAPMGSEKVAVSAEELLKNSQIVELTRNHIISVD